MGANEVRQLSLATTTKQSLLSLVFNIGGILAGAIVVSSLGLFSRETWIIALYPGILSVRGVIGGLFSGHLGTSLHLGTLSTSFFGENTKKFYSLWGSIAVLTFESSILLWFTAVLFGVAFLGINISNILVILGTLLATMGLSMLLISPLTIAIAFSSFKKGLDPDIIVYPIESTMADILVTLCYALILNMLFKPGLGWFVVAAICVAFVCVVLIILHKNRKDPEFLRTVKESLYMLLMVSLIVNITGAILSRIGESVRHKSEIYFVYPALIDTIGDFGAIVGSTATTKLALGTMDSSLKAIRNHRNQIVGSWLASAMMYIVYALISSFYQVSIGFFATLRFIGLLLATNVFAAIFMIFISFSVAIVTFHEGLDPDNFVIPIESSLADTITTISLLVMLILFGGF